MSQDTTHQPYAGFEGKPILVVPKEEIKDLIQESPAYHFQKFVHMSDGGPIIGYFVTKPNR